MSSFAPRGPMAAISRRTRAYFAPVNRETGAPAIYDPSKHGAFELDTPPAPWIDLGWLESLKRIPATSFATVRAGAKGAPTAQLRRKLEARVECEFREWGKLQMALAGGSQHMNVLAADVNADAMPSGGSPLSATAVLPGSTAQELIFGAGAVEAFADGDLLAVDVDYQQQTGYVGTGVAGAYVNNPVDVLRDRHYVRRVTFNVGRVALKTVTTVTLAQPLIGGVPPAGAAAQKVVAFVDREGGSFFQEWSALFVLEQESGARVCFHYPRLQPAAPAGEMRFELPASLSGWALHASFLALPLTDFNDGEQVVCYRSFFPAPSSALY
ncbi:MAG: hypothetical protein LAN64_02400 [Acidobacteriia bacterium]|nr:hypothetical protein [Terriglobia bacterium]